MQSTNRGLSEGADLAEAFKSILRDHSGPALLQTYDRFHRAEWLRLLGLKMPIEPSVRPSPWARRHFPAIIGNLPASGDDFNRLVEKL